MALKHQARKERLLAQIKPQAEAKTEAKTEPPKRTWWDRLRGK